MLTQGTLTFSSSFILVSLYCGLCPKRTFRRISNQGRVERNGGYSCLKALMCPRGVPVFLPCTSNEEASCWQLVASTALVILLGILQSCQSALQLLLLPASCSSAAVLFFSLSHTPVSLFWDALFFTFLLNYFHMFQFSPCVRSFRDFPSNTYILTQTFPPTSRPLAFIE